MTFVHTPLAFAPGLYANRSKRASQQRWVDGNHVRFRDDVPTQMGGWRKLPVVGATLSGRVRGCLSWRPNNQGAKLAAVGTNTGCWIFDGGSLSSITPAGFVPGRIDSLAGVGFGAGLYGHEAYGTPRASSGNILSAVTWSFDMFGEILLSCFSSDGVIREYHDGTDVALISVANAPSARCIVVTPERHVMAFGCNNNPALVMWSDRENRNQWVPASTNRAGSYEMQVSSPFQCAKRVRGKTLAWTETEVVGFFPTFNALVYGRETLHENGGAAGPLAVCVLTDREAEAAYWWGHDGFYVFDGTVRRLPCELQDFVFNDINFDQRAKFEAATNVEFQEIRFSYCSAGSSEIDRCVVYCAANGTWTKAHLPRTTWLDRKIFQKPIAFDVSGDIYEHEVGETANGSQIPSYVLSHAITIGIGQQFTDIEAFWPDLDDMSDGAALTVIGREFAGAPDVVFGPYPFQRGTEKVDLTISVRQYQIKISGTGSYWEIGVPALSIQQSGGR